MFSADGIDHLIRDIGLVFSITFVIPMIAAVAGTIAGNLAAFQTYRKGAGQKDG